jgi:hypothetical protein
MLQKPANDWFAGFFTLQILQMDAKNAGFSHCVRVLWETKIVVFEPYIGLQPFTPFCSPESPAWERALLHNENKAYYGTIDCSFLVSVPLYPYRRWRHASDYFHRNVRTSLPDFIARKNRDHSFTGAEKVNETLNRILTNDNASTIPEHNQWFI